MRIDRVTLIGGQLYFEDHAISPPQTIYWQDLRVALSDIGYPLSRPAAFSLHAFNNDRAGIDFVQLSILGRCAVRGLEHRLAREVVEVAAWRDANAADLGGERIGEIIAVEVRGGDDIELVRAGQHLLQRDVGNSVLHEPACCSAFDERRNRMIGNVELAVLQGNLFSLGRLYVMGCHDQHSVCQKLRG